MVPGRKAISIGIASNNDVIEPHTMPEGRLLRYCTSKVHSLFLESAVSSIVVRGQFDRTKRISDREKTDKRFNFKRPTAKIIDGVGHLYCFPGRDYVDHYCKIYKHLGFSVTSDSVYPEQTRQAIDDVFPELPKSDILILGYVDVLASEDVWQGNDNIQWRFDLIGNQSVLLVGVCFSYWGDIIYYLTERLSEHCETIIYVGKLGSLHGGDIPNRTIATGNSSCVGREIVEWQNIFEHSRGVVSGDHVSMPSVLDETMDWANLASLSFRFVDPEVGWIAKAAKDNGLRFSYLHLVTDNLSGLFDEDLTTERDQIVLEKRKETLKKMKCILESVIADKSIFDAVIEAQQKRVDRGLLQPLERNWKACLSFAYHTQEEACEVVRELPRREWKDQEVIPENVLAELADVQIQLMTTLAYAGFSEHDLAEAILTKLGTKRPDWK